MATKTKPKPKGRRAKQGHLNGMEPPSIREIDAAADAYTEVRDSRMELTKREVEQKTILLAAMKKHELTTYDYDGKVVRIVAKEKLSVRSKDSEDIEVEDDDE